MIGPSEIIYQKPEFSESDIIDYIDSHFKVSWQFGSTEQIISLDRFCKLNINLYYSLITQIVYQYQKLGWKIERDGTKFTFRVV